VDHAAPERRRKDELGVKLIQAVSDVEGLANDQKNKEASSAQFYGLEPEKLPREVSSHALGVVHMSARRRPVVHSR
jgi:hypothetical protein